MLKKTSVLSLLKQERMKVDQGGRKIANPKKIEKNSLNECQRLLNIALMGLILNIKPHLQGQDIFF